MARCKMRARASGLGDRVDGERGGACGVAKRTCVHSAASGGCAGQCGTAPKGTESLHWSWSKSRKRLRAPIHGGTWQGEMRLGRRVCRTRSQGARESNSQPGEVPTRMRLGCSCLVWGTLFMSFVAWRILTFKFERPSHFAESAPSRRRVEISSVARFNRIRVGQLDNFKTALAARSPLHAPAAP